ncbi:MAG: AAA family ATPase [Candidatus Hydrothermarchaeales archaeon]
MEEGVYFKVKTPRWSWSTIGGLKDVKDRLEEMVSMPLKYPEVFDKAKLQPPSGILLWGPPGGGKTVLAEAAAESADCGYVSVKAIEIMSEPEEISKMYDTALEMAPCVVFINEVDALAPKRDAESLWMDGITRDAPMRVAPEDMTAILYRELDRVSRKGVVTLGGTYRPDVLDPLITKKGRLERKVYVPPPNYEDRMEIFKHHLRKTPLSKDVSLEKLAERTEYYVGADIVGVVKEAGVLAIKEKGGKFDMLEARHFKEGMKRIPPSLSAGTMKKYEETLKLECDHCYLF